MRKLKLLCRKLKRGVWGRNLVVLSSGRGNYAVYEYVGPYYCRLRSFSTVRECEQFLTSLFR